MMQAAVTGTGGTGLGQKRLDALIAEDIVFTNSVVSTDNKSRTVAVTVEDNIDLDEVD